MIMRVEEIALRQEIRQILSEADINKNTLKAMAKDVLNEMMENAIKQALNEKDIDGAISRKIEYCADKQAEKLFVMKYGIK